MADTENSQNVLEWLGKVLLVKKEQQFEKSLLESIKKDKLKQGGQ